MINEITSQEVIGYCRTVLGVQEAGHGINDVFLTSMLRRTAGIVCPCSRSVLRSALGESLSHLGEDQEILSQRIAALIDDLIVAGDLLELSDVAYGDTENKGTWVFAAPPAFVERKSGSIFLTGIVPDQDAFLPDDLVTRIEFASNTRTIRPREGEDLAEKLADEGLTRLPESNWLKAPKKQKAREVLRQAVQRLSSEAECAPIQGLEMIDPETKATYYRGRWSLPQSHSGMFVARRPQEFGASLWCFVELRAGNLVRAIDLPFSAYRWRGCDAAWHLQMAIDGELDNPQRYLLSDKGDDTCRIDFFSPIPLWAERRLMVLGKKRPGKNSLFAYDIPAVEAVQEEEFLRENLWLLPLNNNLKGGTV